MLSPITRVVLEGAMRAKKRRIADLHLAPPRHEAAVHNTRLEIAEHSADLDAVTADLARDDQARADACADLPDTSVAEHERRRAIAKADPALRRAAAGEVLPEVRDDLLAAGRPPVSLTGAHLTDTTTAQEG